MKQYLAFYLRLSCEDDNLEDESNSITNQRNLLYDYISKNLELQKYEIKEYIDDGFSGKNFERPSIQKLFNDIRQNKIYGIVVKDLSRFGRDYITVGDYIEKIFPLLNIRFIAINNYYDNYCNKNSNLDISITFENLIYDYYSVESSIAIKNSLINKRGAGKAICVKAPYGYKKSEENSTQLVIDEEAAKVIKLIFNLYQEVGIKEEVARHLNHLAIPTPQQYAEIKKIPYNWRYKTPKAWNGTIIGKILTNQVYQGDLVYHRKEVIESVTQKVKTLPQNEWLTFENAHEAIISRETFNIVNQMILDKSQIRKNKKIVNSNHSNGKKILLTEEASYIKSFLKCGGCKHSLTRRSGHKASYYCKYYYANKHPDCCNGSIKEIELQEIIFSIVKSYINLLADSKTVYRLKELSNIDVNKGLEEDIENMSKKINQLKNENFNTYERYQKGDISKELLISIKEKNSQEINRLEKLILSCQNKKVEKKEEPNIFNIFKDNGDIKELNKNVLEQLIEVIYLYPNNKVEIVFRYKNEFESLLNSK